MSTAFVRGYVAALAALCLLLSGCGSLVGRDSVPANESRAGTPAPPNQTPAPPEQGAGPLPIPSPAQVYEQLHGAKQASSLLTRDASDFVPGFSHRVTTIEPDAILSPAWENGYSPFETIAWAIYRFDLTARTGRLEIHTQWPQPPKDYKLLWLGASDWQKNRWQWYNGAPNGVVQTAAGAIDTFKHPDTGEMYVAVVLLGQTSALLRKVWLTCSLRGDWWMCGRNQTLCSCSPFGGPDYPAVKWQLQAGNVISGLVYDANGVIYYFTESANTPPEVVACAVNPDGALKWAKPVGSFNGHLAGWSPALDDDGTLYCGYGDTLYAVSPDGALKWTYKVHEQITSSPAIAPDGTIHIEGHEFIDPTDLGYHYAINRDGTERWVYCYGGPYGGGMSAIATDSSLYAIGDAELLAFAADGAVKWRYDLDAGGQTSAAVGPDGTIYVADASASLHALHPDGSLKWLYPLAANVGSYAGGTAPSVGADGAVYIRCYDGNLYAISADGQLRWSFRAGPCNGQATVDGAGTVYVKSQDSRLYAIRSDGTLKWWFDTYTECDGPPVIGEDGTLYFEVFREMGSITLFAIGPGSQLEERTAAGYVRDEDGAGLAGVTVSIGGEEPALTDGSGYWSKSGLTDGAYLASPTKGGYQFSPLFEVLTINGDDAVMDDFSGSPLPPIWPVEGLNRAHTRRSPYTGPASPTVKWQIRVSGDGTCCEPMIAADGALIVLGNTRVLTVFNPDGTVRWQRDKVRDSYGNCPALGPDGTIYTHGETLLAFTPGNILKWSDAGNGGTPVSAASGSLILWSNSSTSGTGIRALSPKGTEEWSFSPAVRYYNQTAPAIADDGTIYCGNGGDALVAVDAEGSEKWTAPAPPDTGQPYWQWTPSVGADGTVYFGSGVNFYAFNPDGTQQWVYTCDTPLVSSPAIGADGALYFAKGETDTLDSYKLIALSPDGSLRWEYYPDGYGFTSPPTIDANGTLYIGIGGALHAVNPDGTRKWTFEDPAGKVAGVAIGTDGTLYFGESEGKVYALGPGRG